MFATATPDIALRNRGIHYTSSTLQTVSVSERSHAVYQIKGN